jgi:hypothetical protein
MTLLVMLRDIAEEVVMLEMLYTKVVAESDWKDCFRFLERLDR